MTGTLQTDRTTVRRLPERAAYDAESVYRILDEALICHAGFVVHGDPVVIPTIHWREGDRLYFHGAHASGLLRNLKNGVPVCVTVTLLDGLVMARSAFHHSMNYRSVVVFGIASEVTDREEKLRALDALVEHVCRGRSKDVRPPNEKELKQTLLLSIPISEASAKVRTGGPVDDDEDYDRPNWPGVLPMRLVPLPAITDERSHANVPDYVATYRR